MELRIAIEDTKLMVVLAVITGISFVGLALAYGGNSPTIVGHSLNEIDFPKGTVMLFNLTSCPEGWSEMTAARGRYLVGMPSGGALGGIDGTPLSNLEDRPVGQHTHTAQPANYVNTNAAGSTPYGPGYIPVYGYVTSSLTTNPAGTVPGTNAPYIQLLVCIKN